MYRIFPLIQYITHNSIKESCYFDEISTGILEIDLACVSKIIYCYISFEVLHVFAFYKTKKIKSSTSHLLSKSTKCIIKISILKTKLARSGKFNLNATQKTNKKIKLLKIYF